MESLGKLAAAELTHPNRLAQINRQFNQFTKRVQTDIWERDFGSALLLTVAALGHVQSRACCLGHHERVPESPFITTY